VTQQALIVADCYREALDELPHAKDRGCLSNTVKVREAARACRIPIIYTATVFRPGYPEINMRNMVFRARKAAPPTPPEPIDRIHPALSPSEDEVVLGKHRISAFHGTPLDLILRAQEVDHVFLFGFATSGVILSTVRYASDCDYEITVVEDCCVDREPRVHDLLMEHILPQQANVVNAEAVIRSLAR